MTADALRFAFEFFMDAALARMKHDESCPCSIPGAEHDWSICSCGLGEARRERFTEKTDDDR